MTFTITNAMRAARAEAALQAYADHKGEPRDRDCDVRDLLADLMHWCDAQQDDEHGTFSFAEELRAATRHHEAEVAEEADEPAQPDEHTFLTTRGESPVGREALYEDFD